VERSQGGGVIANEQLSQPQVSRRSSRMIKGGVTCRRRTRPGT